MLPVILLLLVGFAMAERIFVVERERSSVRVIEAGKVVGHLGDLGDMTHGLIKFRKGTGYVLSRDGILTVFEPESLRVRGSVKVGESSVGFTFCGEWIAVANYRPGSLALVREDLSSVREIPFGSRLVGIKARDRKLFFSLMDTGGIVAYDCKNLKVIKVIKGAGPLPFDALLTDRAYFVAFFGDHSFGFLNPETLAFRRVASENSGGIPLKVPHLGLWGVNGDVAYVPSVGEERLYLFDLREGEILSSIKLPAKPVFAVLSPDKKLIAVNYSGEGEDYVSLIDAETLSLLRTVRAGRRITHLRFSPDGKRLYLSSYFENELKALSVPDLRVLWRVKVPTPSGVFVYGE